MSNRMSHISKYTRSYLDRELDGTGIDGSSFGTMMYLFRKQGITEKEISEHMLVDKATTTRTISKLEGFGYIRRKRDPSDRRAYRVYLTEKAEKVKSDLMMVRDRWVDIVLKDMSRTEKDEILELLHRMEKNLEESRDGGF